MSFLGKIFGGGKKDQSMTTGEAIQKLRETEEMLMKKLLPQILLFLLLLTRGAISNETFFVNGLMYA